MIRFRFFVLYLFFVCGFYVVSQPDIYNSADGFSVAYKVVEVKDGDTFVLKTNSQKLLTVRLAHVDCPEKKQPFGSSAKRFATKVCLDKYVTLRIGKKLCMIEISD